MSAPKCKFSISSSSRNARRTVTIVASPFCIFSLILRYQAAPLRGFHDRSRLCPFLYSWLPSIRTWRPLWCRRRMSTCIRVALRTRHRSCFILLSSSVTSPCCISRHRSSIVFGPSIHGRYRILYCRSSAASSSKLLGCLSCFTSHPLLSNLCCTFWLHYTQITQLWLACICLHRRFL